MLTTENLTFEAVNKELTELEAAYRAKKRKLRALLAVLQIEATVRAPSVPVKGGTA